MTDSWTLPRKFDRPSLAVAGQSHRLGWTMGNEMLGTKTVADALFHMARQTLSATAFKSPAIALSGVVDYEMYTKFRTQFDTASDQNIVARGALSERSALARLR
jgi:hypothetical protein